MAKDIYKTFKRSISHVTGVGNSGESAFDPQSSSNPSTSHVNVKYRGGSGRTWIHPPDFLINGRVEYVARFLGSVETAKPHGSDVAREAIHAIRFQRDLKRSEQSRESAKLQKVDIQISIDHVVIADTKTKQVLHKFPLGRISFCADDKDDKRMFSFIARADGSNSKHSCFAFTSEKLAEEITLTIGEAFDLAYKRFLDKNRSSLENQKQVFILRKRIAELEAENQVLSERLAESIRSNRGVNLLDSPCRNLAPALPTSPMPQAPPPNMAGSAIYSTPRQEDILSVPLEVAPKLPTPGEVSPSGPAPNLPPPRAPMIAPPPPVAPRRSIPLADSSKQLEGIELGNQKEKDVFDDSFDPRAGEKKEGKYDPFGEDFMPEKLTNGSAPSPASSSSPPAPPPKTAADFQAMIDKVDMKLAEMSTSGGASDDFEFGQLQTGELCGIDAENDYGTPSDRLNPQVMNLKQ